MLAIFRVERALSVTIPYHISKSVPYFQRSYSCGGMNNNYKMVGGNSNNRIKEMKKHKSVASEWRPVSMPCCSADDGHGEAELGTELAEPHINPTSLSAKEKDNAYARGSMPSTGKHSISLKVGSSLFRFIKGTGGSVQSKIQEEMGIKIIFPSSRNEESIIIEGTSLDSITRASERIQHIIEEAVKSPALDYSHFISLPLAIHPQLVDKLVNFQNSILGLHDLENQDQKSDKATQVAFRPKPRVKVDVTNIPLVSYPPKFSTTSTSTSTSTSNSTLLELGIDKSIFIKPKTFHLTVLMLKLWNKDRVDAAVKIFKGIAGEIMDALNGRPVSIKLKGLDLMRGSPAKACVLYAPVEVVGGEDRLLRACKVITEAFKKGGLVLEKDAKQTLKLHATVMNVRHRKRTKKTKKYDSFDARGIMEKYGSKEWGKYLISEVHLSQRFVFDEDGYYHRCASILLPKNGD